MFELMPFGRNDLYRPFRDLENLERSFFSGKELGGFKTDIKDTGDAYVLEADLPGVKKEDIHIDLDDNALTIRAERHSNYEQQDKKGNYVRCERSYGSYARSFGMDGIRTEGIKASYADGVLKLTLPKASAEAPQTRRLEIE